METNRQLAAIAAEVDALKLKLAAYAHLVEAIYRHMPTRTMIAQNADLMAGKGFAGDHPEKIQAQLRDILQRLGS